MVAVSATSLADAGGKLRVYCIEGTRLHKASAIAHKANDEGTTLRAGAVASGYVSAAEFDRVVRPTSMVLAG